MLLAPFPYIARTFGWMTAELGRQPWVIYGLMRTAQGISPPGFRRQRPVHSDRFLRDVRYALSPVPFYALLRGPARPDRGGAGSGCTCTDNDGSLVSQGHLRWRHSGSGWSWQCSGLMQECSATRSLCLLIGFQIEPLGDLLSSALRSVQMLLKR
jgi:hypothetical protein